MEGPDEGEEERFDKCFFWDLGLLLMLTPLILIPLIGWVLVFIMVPLWVGHFGGRFVNKKDAALAGAMASGIWATIAIVMVFYVLDMMRMPGASVGVHTGLEAALLLSAIGIPVTFCAIGGFSGGRRRDVVGG